MTVDDSTPQTKANIIFYCLMKAVVDMQNTIFNFMPSFILMLIYLSLSIVIVVIIARNYDVAVHKDTSRNYYMYNYTCDNITNIWEI